MQAAVLTVFLALAFILADARSAEAAPVVTALTSFFTSLSIGAEFAASLASFLVRTLASATLSP